MEWGVEGLCVREGEPAWLASPLCSVLSAAMSEQKVPSSVAQCLIIKFLTNERDFNSFEGTVWGHYSVSELSVYLGQTI